MLKIRLLDLRHFAIDIKHTFHENRSLLGEVNVRVMLYHIVIIHSVAWFFQKAQPL